MNTTQLTILAAHIGANPTWVTGLSQGPDVQRTTAEAIVADLNAPASPGFWVFRTNVTRADIYHSNGPEGSSWSWTTYKAQTVAEQNAWVQMFMGDQADFSKANFRAGIDAIFSGSGAPATQRTHIHSVGRRLANGIEKLLKILGTGTTIDPATMSFEGEVTMDNVLDAWQIHVGG